MWIQKQDPYICCLQETHFTSRDTYKFKVRGWKKIFHANRDQKKAGVPILKIKKYLEANGNKDMTLQNLWDAAKGILRGKLIAIQAHLRKQEKAQINKLT
uniref:Uncharacterized protein n=1 Tax=Sus scrofa TaxID=9823 RepID=A0A8W4FKG3_PIG